MYNFGKSVNRVVIPELSEMAVLQSVKNAGTIKRHRKIIT